MRKFLRWVMKYEDSDYCCPNCGKPTSECTGTDWYSHICPDCEIEFETPDT